MFGHACLQFPPIFLCALLLVTLQDAGNGIARLPQAVDQAVERQAAIDAGRINDVGPDRNDAGAAKA